MNVEAQIEILNKRIDAIEERLKAAMRPTLGLGEAQGQAANTENSVAEAPPIEQ